MKLILLSCTSTTTVANMDINIMWDLLGKDLYKLTIISASPTVDTPQYRCPYSCQLTGRVQGQSEFLPSVTVVGGQGSVDLFALARNMVGKSWSITDKSDENCVDFYLKDTVNPGQTFLGSACAIKPKTKPEQKSQCNVVQTSPMIDYGALSKNQINDSLAYTYVDITCNIPTAVKVTINDAESDSDTIDMGGNIFATLGVNGKRGHEGVSIKDAKYESIMVTSILKAYGNIEAGSFSRSAILKITFN